MGSKDPRVRGWDPGWAGWDLGVSRDRDLGIRGLGSGDDLGFVKFVGIQEYPGGDCGLGIRDLGVGTWGSGNEGLRILDIFGVWGLGSGSGDRDLGVWGPGFGYPGTVWKGLESLGRPWRHGDAQKPGL